MDLKVFKKKVIDSFAMEDLGSHLYKAVLKNPVNGIVIYLIGDLGAGKTTLVRGFLRAMNYRGIVKSPTYTLVEPYDFENEIVYHFDFYRMNDPEELALMGIRDYFHEKAYCLIEWPQNAKGCITPPDLSIQIELAESARNVTIEALSERGKDVLQAYERF